MENTDVQTKTGSITDLIKMINRAKETFQYEVYIPSLKKHVMFREISTNQQKRLIKAIIDNQAFNTEFIFCLHQIILENCTETIDLKTLNIYDKLIIALTMRAMSISNDLDITFTIPDTQDVIKRRISIKDLIDVAINKVDIQQVTITDQRNVFTLVCDLPSIEDEYNLEKELRKNITNNEIKTQSDLRDTVGEVFTNETVKYIKKITLPTDDGNTMDIDMKSLPFQNRLSILATLPAQVTNEVLKYIAHVQEEFGKVLLFSEVINGKKVEQRLKIDASFFTHY